MWNVRSNEIEKKKQKADVLARQRPFFPFIMHE